jgi:hypothetical protein
MRKSVLAAAVIAFGTLPALAQPPSPPSYTWYPTSAGLTQQAFEADRRRCLLQSLPYFGGANPNPLAVVATLIICMENRGWAVRGNSAALPHHPTS